MRRTPVRDRVRGHVPWLAALGLALAACGSHSDTTVIRASGIEMRVSGEPASPRVGSNELRVELRDAQGQPIEGALLEAKVQMPAMGAMPPMGGPAKVRELGGGRYLASYRIDMGGSWRLEVAVRTSAGGSVRAEGSLRTGSAGLRLESAGEAPPGDGSTPAADAAGPPPSPAAQAEHPGEFQMAPERLQRIGVRTARVERRAIAQPIRAAGRVTYDETALQDVSLKVRGWVGALRADAVGDRVEKGGILFTLYSPELLAAQQEYLLVLRSQERARETSSPDRVDSLVDAARNRLRLWDVAPAELAQIALERRALEQLPIRSPASGYVLEKSIVAGSAVEPGQRLYRIAPLDRVWVEAQVYEAEVPLVRVGMPAEVTLPYLPGRRFQGSVAWLYPELSGGTHTARVRVELANPGLELRPDMLATVLLQPPLEERLVVPLSAVLHAGERSFVFLDLGGGRLRPQRVEVGLRSGEEVEIRSGLEEGQAVVASATFLVAAESRLRAALEQW
jgi:Cu(I)/Ag(I) efflux system membrane fusion protein